MSEFMPGFARAQAQYEAQMPPENECPADSCEECKVEDCDNREVPESPCETKASECDGFPEDCEECRDNPKNQLPEGEINPER